MLFAAQALGLIGNDPVVVPTPAPIVITVAPMVAPESTPPAASVPTGAALPVQVYVPTDTTDQAAAVYAINQQLVDDCMRAAVEIRRSSPACTEVLRALGSGR